MNINYPSYLMHYGVKGMRWGVRKDPRYESRRTRRLRTGIESYDVDIADKSFSPRAHKMLVRDREKLYRKYNKSKDKDYRRKQLANRHPSHLRNLASLELKGLGASAVIGTAALGAMTVSTVLRSKKGSMSLRAMQKDARLINAGVAVASTYSTVKLIGEHFERARAIEEVQKNGRFADVRR